MSKPTLILINGAPGSGKTTLLRRLSSELTIPAIGKNDIKEFLFNALGYSDRDWSRILGRVSVETLYLIAGEFLQAGHTVLIENAFWPQFAQPHIDELTKGTDCVVLEIYCQTDDETRMIRFRERYESGERHAGHVDNLATYADATNYGQLTGEQAVIFDTTTPTEQDFQSLLAQLRPTLQ